MAKLNKAAHYFLAGVGSVLSVQASPRPPYIIRSDEDTMRSDWVAIGQDISLGLQKFERHQQLIQPELNLVSETAHTA